MAFDPRGNSRSPFDGPPEPLDLDVQADDAARLIAALGVGPAYVFGTSGGAQIGLNLAARHPDLVRALVAHEPPVTLLLDDPSEALAADREIHETYLRDGVDAAKARFFAMADMDVGASDAPAPAPRKPRRDATLISSTPRPAFHPAYSRFRPARRSAGDLCPTAQLSGCAPNSSTSTRELSSNHALGLVFGGFDLFRSEAIHRFWDARGKSLQNFSAR